MYYVFAIPTLYTDFFSKKEIVIFINAIVTFGN